MILVSVFPHIQLNILGSILEFFSVVSCSRLCLTVSICRLYSFCLHDLKSQISHMKFGVFLEFFSVAILKYVHKIYYPTNRLRRTLKKFQCQFFGTENAFCEHYGLTRFFRGFAFHVSKLPRAKGKMDIFGCPEKCPKNGGVNCPSSIPAIGRFQRRLKFHHF